MARLIALEWDTCEARVAIGRTSGKSVIAEAALAVDLTDLTEPTTEALQARIAEACKRHLSQRAATLVAVPRSRAEVRMLQIPPAPATEMPVGTMRTQRIMRAQNRSTRCFFRRVHYVVYRNVDQLASDYKQACNHGHGTRLINW